MVKGIYRFCSGFLALFLLSITVVPCYASDGSMGGGSFGGGVGRSDFFTWTDGFGGGSFGGGAGRDDAAAAYNTYVQDLPATGYNSNGRLIWQPTISDLYLKGEYSSFRRSDNNLLPFSSFPGTLEQYSCSFNSSGNGIMVTFPVDSTQYVPKPMFYVWFYFYGPCAGSYSYIGSLLHSSSCVNLEGDIVTSSSNYEPKFIGHFDKIVHITTNDIENLPRDCASGNCQVYFPVFEVIPDSSLSADTYSTTTRPTSISGGNYGVVGDNNEITKVEDNSTIVNETNNTYYNPATGATVPITDWSYDYSDRSYKVTMESGDTATVTYGDENISITETNTTSGDTVTNNYTIYYLVDAPDPSSCTHEWSETSTTPSTCTVPGSKLLTCSLCSLTKTESIPVMGHDWEVKKSVITQYDETGQLIQQGYTLYECGTCHEQYKSEDGALPPAVNPDAGTDLAAVDALKEKLKIAADALLGIFDKLPEVFTGFTDFLAAVFPFVPPEFITIFELGLFLLIAAAALRKFLS